LRATAGCTSESSLERFSPVPVAQGP
jgi:hypothetical protein